MPRGVGVRVPLSAQARHFFECRVFAYKGTRTRCGGSADLSVVIDCASCDTTTNIGRVSVAQASLALTLTPYSIPTVFRPINSPWSALALLNSVRVPGVQP